MIKKIRKQEKGFVLIGSVILLIVLGLFVGVSTDMLIFTNSQTDYTIGAAKALSISHGGGAWYMELLENDSDWTDQTDLGPYTLGEGSFTVTIDSASTDRVDYTVTGYMSVEAGVEDVSRTFSQSIVRMTPAFQFAVYQNNSALDLTLNTTSGTPTTVNGDIWAEGGSDVRVNNVQQGGKIFHPTGTNAIGAGTYSSKEIPLVGKPTFPLIDSSSYTAVMDAYDTALAALGSVSNRTLNNADMDINTHAWCSGALGSRVCNFNTFEARGSSVNITGNGTIYCAADCRFHYRSSESGTLNITPDSGGSINIVAQNNIYIGHANGGGTINVNTSASGARSMDIYCQGTNSTARLTRIRGYQTTLNNSANQDSRINFYTRRRILISDGAQINGKNLFFVDDTFPFTGENTNNFYQQTGEAVNATRVSGNVIALGRNTNDAVRLSGGFSGGVHGNYFEGLIYQYSPLGNGECDIDDAVVTGSIICNRYVAAQIKRSVLTYDADVLTRDIPAGFEAYITRVPKSWDGF